MEITERIAGVLRWISDRFSGVYEALDGLPLIPQDLVDFFFDGWQQFDKWTRAALALKIDEEVEKFLEARLDWIWRVAERILVKLW